MQQGGQKWGKNPKNGNLTSEYSHPSPTSYAITYMWNLKTQQTSDYNKKSRLIENKPNGYSWEEE